MKKIILLALTPLMMVGCHIPDYKRIDKWQILELDSCEYIRADSFHGYVHKGNCRFCKERRQKELEGLVTKLKEK